MHASTPTRAQYKRFQNNFDQVIYLLSDRSVRSQRFQQSELYKQQQPVSVVEDALLTELASALKRHMVWSMVLEEGSLAISDGEWSVSGQFKRVQLAAPA